jgi:hypothetical protein
MGFRPLAAFAIPAALWAVAIWIVGTSAYALVAFRHPLPYSDQWELLAPFATIARDGVGAYLAELWRPHLEHRLVLVRLANTIDHDFFGYRNDANAAMLFAAMAGQVGLLVDGLRRCDADPHRVYAMVLPVVLACVYAGAQSQNLTWAMGLQWHLTNLFAVACAYFVVRAAGASGPAAAAGATLAGLFCAVAASLSSAAGLFVWPIAALLALRFAIPHAAAFYAVAGVATWSAYFAGMPPRAGGAGLLDVFAAIPLEAAAFVVRFVGQPWYHAAFVERLDLAALLAGGAGLLAAGWLAILALRMPAPHRRLAAFAAATVFFVVATAIGAASGRVAEFGALQALTPRYGSAALLLWAALLAFAVSAPRRLGTIAALAALVWFAGYQPRMIERVEAWYRERELAALTVLAGVPDEERLWPIYPSARHVLELGETLRASGKSVFGEPRAAWLDGFVASFPRADGACAGGIGPLLDVRAIAGGTLLNQRLSGWAIETATNRPPRDLVIVRAHDGRIVGLGRSGFEGGQWEAVIRPAEGTLHVYAVVRSAERPALCPL